MISYDPGVWGFAGMLRISGSVLPRALALAIPNMFLTIFLNLMINELLDETQKDAFVISGLSTSQVWTTYNWSLGFLIGFRTQQAYSRWWEGGTLLQQARGEWFNAYSSLIAFCSSKPDKRPQVERFQHLLARLMSMLFSAALEQISQAKNTDFEIIEVSGVDMGALDFLRQSTDRVEIILQWIQKLVVESMSQEIVPIAPPVISRVFQELSRGIVNFNNVRKITEFLFPFPYAQMISAMLAIHWLLSPFITSIIVDKWYWAGIVSFLSNFTLWSVNYIAT